MNGIENGLISRMPFSELYKIMVNKVTFVGFRGRPIVPVDLPLVVRRAGLKGRGARGNFH